MRERERMRDYKDDHDDNDDDAEGDKIAGKATGDAVMNIFYWFTRCSAFMTGHDNQGFH